MVSTIIIIRIYQETKRRAFSDRQNQVGKQLSEISQSLSPSLIDRDAANLAWEDELARAAIKKERKEMRFVEPGSRRTTMKEEREWPTRPPVPEPIQTSPQFHFSDAAKVVTNNKEYRPPAKLARLNLEIITTLRTLENNPKEIKEEGKTLSEVLEFRGIALARVTKDEAERSHRESAFARAIGNHVRRYDEGEIVALRKSPVEYRREGLTVDPIKVHRLDQTSAVEILKALAPGLKLESIEKTKVALAKKPLGQKKDWDKIRLKNATKIRPDFSRKIKAPDKVLRDKAPKAFFKTMESGFSVIGGIVDSLFASKMSPKQEREAEQSKAEREVKAEETIDIAQFSAKAALERSRGEEDRMRNQREHLGRER